jgi:hypothetical protein
MKRSTWSAVVALTLIGGFAAYLNLHPDVEPPSAPLPQVEAPPPLAPMAPEPAIRHPLTIAPETTPLPSLNDSDAPFLKAVGELLGKRWMAVFLDYDVIHRLVVTIDNLPRRQMSSSNVPLKSPPRAFVTVGKDESLAIAPGNAARYAGYAKLAGALDATRVADLYFRFYPLFQKAYDELGYPNAYFNDRLVEAIDDLLAAPEPAAPIKLVQPGILYKFADPELEARSAGQKIMIRMGRENALRIKAKLREIRQIVARGPATPS